jgi:hypothetical protein
MSQIKLTAMASTKKITGSLIRAILLTGLLVGLLDGLAAIIQYTINGGTKPGSVFKYIATAVFGKKAYSGGTPMVAWGVFFHLLIAILFTAFFFLALARIRWVQENKLLAGVLYGIFVWIVMTRLVIPLSLLTQPQFDIKKALIAVTILIVCIGIPVSLLANKYYRSRGTIL